MADRLTAALACEAVRLEPRPDVEALRLAMNRADSRRASGAMLSAGVAVAAAAMLVTSARAGASEGRAVAVPAAGATPLPITQRVGSSETAGPGESAGARPGEATVRARPGEDDDDPRPDRLRPRL